MIICTAKGARTELFVRSCNYFHSISIIIEARENAAETRASFFLATTSYFHWNTPREPPGSYGINLQTVGKEAGEGLHQTPIVYTQVDDLELEINHDKRRRKSNL